MLSRIFWVGIAGIALVAGIAIQDGGSFFGWGDHDRGIDRSIDRAVDRSVDRTVDRTIDGMQVVGPNGREITVSREAKRALLEAVGRLVKAEAELAALRIADGTTQEVQAASAVRDQARADVDRMKAQIQDQETAARVESDVRRQIRDDIRDTVREAVRN
jgi:hypothetical protein